MAYSITAITATQEEGNTGAVAYTYTISHDVALTAETVPWVVGPDTTTPISANQFDFVGVVYPHGSVAFAIGEKEKTIRFEVQGDIVDEPDTELFLVGVPGQPIVARGWIEDRDDVPDAMTGGSPVLKIGAVQEVSVSTYDRDSFQVQLSSGSTYTIGYSGLGKSISWGALYVYDAWGG